MQLTPEEYTTIGQAISVIMSPTTIWAREHKRDVAKKLLDIMDKYMPIEEE